MGHTPDHLDTRLGYVAKLVGVVWLGVDLGGRRIIKKVDVYIV
jgi:hypothetical protein